MGAGAGERWEWLGEEARCFRFTSLSTIHACPQAMQSVAPQSMRLLCAAWGACSLSGPAQARLQDSRMALLCGPVEYRLDDASGGLMLLQLDFTTARAPAIYAPGAMARHYPSYADYCDRSEAACVFDDAYGLALPLLHNIQAYAASGRDQCTALPELAIASLMLLATDARHAGADTRACGNPHVQAALAYIHENYMHSIGAESIAAHLGMHPNSLHRLFTAHMGVTLLQYINTYRVDKAKALLVGSEYTVREVAMRVGFSDRRYFAKVFRRATGVTPQQHRKDHNLTSSYEEARTQYAIERYENDMPATNGKGGHAS